MPVDIPLDHESDCDSSVDTNDAFMDMLGFSSHIPSTLDVDEDIEDTVCGARQNDRKGDYVETNNPAVPSTIRCNPINLPPKCSRHHLDPASCLALVLDDVVSLDQCQSVVQMADKGFRYITEATHKAPDGTSSVVQIQNPNPHKLSAIDTHHDPQQVTTSTPRDSGTILLDELYSKIFVTLKSHPSYQHYEKRTQCGEMQGLNPRMRVLKYDAKDNDRFEAHFDATTYVPGQHQRRQSLITILLYLNDGEGEDFDGGETLYLDSHNSTAGEPNYENVIKVVPKAGRVVLFEHGLFHSGAPLGRGTKYIMRTDVLFDEQQDHEEKKEEDLKSDVEDADGELSKGLVLVSEICKEIELSSAEMRILFEMDLLESTCEAMLAPGITLMKHMLIDAGIDRSVVNVLFEKAIAEAKS